MPFEIQNWDQGGTWDAGFQFDVNSPNINADLTPYLDLVTSEHRDKLKFIDALSVVLQPLADLQVVVGAMPSVFDLDLAVGDQLDKTGQWIGRTRFISAPLTGVYFSFDTLGVGFDEGVWQGPFDPDSGLVALPDDIYRRLLYATVAANQWDGSIPGAYEIWAIIFEPLGNQILIIDGGDMTMQLGIAGPLLDAATYQLFVNGYLNLKPAGVRITDYIVPTVGGPLFGFDIENSTISGFDVGGWGAIVPA